mmetsp:Transcript_25303/g.88303  ORF Transcript_25303/g.88303 Transcript_25303/m.88303 type:complete len:324 (-) Transcript_25303:67-1038(-)
MGQVQSVLEGWPDYFAGKRRPGWSGRYVGIRGGFLASLIGQTGRGHAESLALSGDDHVGVADLDRDSDGKGAEDGEGADGRLSEADLREYNIGATQLFGVAAASAVGFSLMSRVAKVIAGAVDGRFSKLSPVTRRRFPTYINSLVHAALSVGFASYKLVGAGHKTTTGNRSLIAFMLGYFVNDMWQTRADWLSHPADVLHHVMAISITTVVSLLPNLAPFFPMFVVVELSTIFLNLMWLLRTAGRGDTAAYRAMQAAFVSLFMLLRTVWLPIATAHMVLRQRRDFVALGKWRSLFLPINGLQFFWAYKIIQMMRRPAAAAGNA